MGKWLGLDEGRGDAKGHDEEAVGADDLGERSMKGIRGFRCDVMDAKINEKSM